VRADGLERNRPRCPTVVDVGKGSLDACGRDGFGSSLMWSMAAEPLAPSSVSQPGPSGGSTRSGGAVWIYLARIAVCSTRSCPTWFRSRIRFTSTSWRTFGSMSAGVGRRTTRWVIGAARPIPPTGAGVCSLGLMSAGRDKLMGLLEAGDPRGEVRMMWHAKEVVRSIYEITDPEVATEFVTRPAQDLQDESCPAEAHALGRTINRWRTQIVALHRSKVSNGPTEAINNLVKRVKLVASGITNFANYRTRLSSTPAGPTGTYPLPCNPAETGSAMKPGAIQGPCCLRCNPEIRLFGFQGGG
jgi:hypothetical protein